MMILVDSFAPFHNGHQQVIDLALESSSELTLVMGSVDQARSLRCPFTAQERETMIWAALDDRLKSRVTIIQVADDRYRPVLWRNAIFDALQRPADFVQLRTTLEEADYFPVVANRLVEIGSEATACTAVRDAWLDQDSQSLANLVPKPVQLLLERYYESHWFAELVLEHQYVRDYKQAWRAAPYPPVFVTLDALVSAGNRVLLIERGNQPGKGLLALPGGFLDGGETLLDGCLRELREETGLALSAENLVNSGVFAEPARSIRGRTVTHGFHFELSGMPPTVRGGDDAASARWFEVSTLERSVFFEDHFEILQFLLDR